MQPYNYSIDLPAPPADNFLQNIMGIAQLQQMGQQQKIQAQQAAFQKEMQPYEVQKAQAAIAAAKANAAQSATARDVALEGLRQSKATFGREEELNKQADALRADMMKLSSDPTSATREKLLDLSYRAAAFAPKSYEPLQKMLKDYPRTGKVLENTASDVIFSVQSGQPNVATGSVEKALKGAENTLKENPNDKDAQEVLALLEPVQTLMKEEKYGEAMIIASNFLRNTYPERWDAVTKDMKESGAGAKAVAESKKEQALLEGQLLDNRIKQYEADNGISLKDIQKNKEERFKAEAAERVHIESQPFVRQYLGKREAFDMMKTAEPTGVGDKVLLVQFTKMGDPTSIVSVTEEGNSRNITVSDYIASLEARIKSTGSLGDQQRKELKDQAFQMLKTSEKAYKEYKDNLLPAYTERGLNPKNIFVLPSSEQLREDAKKQAAGPAGAPGLPISTGNIPVAPTGVAPAGGVFTIDGFEMKITPRGK
jgi:hypothetical protein